ncbi:uracil-DNA glycosylase [Pseudothauera rhizosphaerae]|uniref:Uracil-DNA glycosylase n=1 Tax=Pseudothauera rhizosphaerae TaxID=2565932 RepID=A0A4S4ADX8_9RHOO|nr:uracil-DNA glycosylase [Pseudothauera rhizosphaerae]THF57217.1 uracil-DNA glycosylase [Pseudothauera rhizosphaerae]
MTNQDTAHAPDCKACAHYYITHDPTFPYGCRRLGFKTRRQPAQDVLASSGLPCMMFEPKGRRAGGRSGGG